MISEFPLFVFTTLGGIAAGAYCASAVLPVKSDEKRSWLLPLIALVLLAVGGVALLFHLGRPERMLLAFANPVAGIAQEGYVTVVLGILVAADLIAALARKRTVRPLRIVAAVAGLAFAVITGLAYVEYFVVAAWSTWQTVVLFLLGDLAMGVALVAVLNGSFDAKEKTGVAACVMYALFALAAVLEAVHFAGIGASVMPVVVAAVLALAACAITRVSALSGAVRMWSSSVLILVTVVVARYMFYAAYAPLPLM